MKFSLSRTFLIANLLLLNLALTRAVRAADGEISASDTSTKSLYHKRGLWYVPAQAGGKSVLAIFSTGSNYVVVNAPNLQHDFPGLVIERGSDPAKGSVSFADLPFSCLGLPERKISAGAMDLTEFSKALVTPMGAAAGMNYLRQFAFVLDPEAGKIVALPSPVALPNGRAMEISWRKELPCVPVTLPDLGSRSFCVHTSLGGAITLTAERIGQLKRMGHLMAVKSDGEKFQVTNGKRRDQPSPSTCVLRWLDFGDIRFRNVNVEIGDRDAVGLKLLQYFKTTIDFPENKLWLEPLTEDNELLMSTHCQGPEFDFDETDRLIVRGAVDGFHLADHGLAEGDHVAALNGIASKELSIRKVQDFLSESGSTITLEMQRGDRQFSVKIPLKHSFDWPPRWPPERDAFDPDFEATLK